MVRVRQNHICCLNEILINLANYGKELNRAAPRFFILSVPQISLFQQIKDHIIDFCRHISHNRFIVVLVANLRRKNFYNNTQIIGSIHSNHKVRHTNFIAEIDYTRQDSGAATDRTYLVSNVIIVMPELNSMVAKRLDNNLIALLLIENRNCPVFTQTSIADNLFGHRLSISFQVDFVVFIAEHLEE